MGGMESHAAEFNKMLSRKNYDITVFTSEIPKFNGKEDGDCEVIRFPAFEIISGYPLPKFWQIAFWSKFGTIWKKDWDLVVSRVRFFFTSFLAMFLAKKKGIFWIHVEHTPNISIAIKSNSFMGRVKGLMAQVYDLLIGRTILKTSDLNISISKNVNKFIHSIDHRRSPVISRGIDFKKIDKALLGENIKKRHNKEIIITVAARLIWWKGVQNVIKAIDLLPVEVKKKTILFVCGDGEATDKLKEISGKNVVFLGSVAREDVFGYLKSSDVYIHSSYPGGGLSTSLLEAMYCRCFIIATPNEGGSELIDKKNGFLIEKSDAEEIRDAIVYYYKNMEEAKKRGLAAKKKALNFSWDKNINKFIAEWNGFK